MFEPSVAWHRAWALLATMAATPQGQLALASVAVAAALVLAAGFVKTMLPLRWLALGSNLGFVIYGALAPSLPMLLLHALLLPINLVRAVQMLRLTRRVRAASQARDTSGLWLRPYMRRRQLAAGTVLFQQGDTADHLYLLAEGEIELVEIGTRLQPGRVFGEIAFFAPDRRRTLTARCVGPCAVLSINESTVRQLCYQNPAFSYELTALVAGRLSADVQRLQARLDSATS